MSVPGAGVECVVGLTCMQARKEVVASASARDKKASEVRDFGALRFKKTVFLLKVRAKNPGSNRRNHNSL